MAGHGRRHDGRVVEVREEAPGVYRVVVEKSGERHVYRVAARDGIVETPWGSYPVSELRRHSAARRGRGSSWLVEVEGGAVHVKLPVRVVQVIRGPGDAVEEGEVVMIVETMKMLNEVKSPCRGRIVEAAEEGGAVESGGLLFRVECG